MNTSSNDLDPFRILLSVLMDRNDSDLLMAAAMSGGLQFDQGLSEAEAHSHKTRVRALVPRITKAYESLSELEKLAVARAVVAHVVQTGGDGALQPIAEALAKVGWNIHDDELVVGTPDLREMFFPKGSQWDAFIVLKDIFAKARKQLMVIDAYADHTLFEFLAGRPMTGLLVQVLCSKSATEVAAAAKRFGAQYPGGIVEVRQSKDFHDRFVVLDDRACIHIGTSINHAGRTAFMVSKLEDETNRSALLAAVKEAWDAGTPVP
jgi:hypothetical protein